jgi:ribulose-5-phosphate 4-epimerase/fuculose-1-phosphate aldolase
MTRSGSTGLESSPDSIAEERERIRIEIVITLRLFAELGFEWGTAGHLTVADPGPKELFWVNPLGVPYRSTRTSDLVLVDRDGAVVEGKHAIAGFSSQYQVHRAAAVNRAVVHVHSPYGFMWSSSPSLLEPLDDDSASIHGLQAVTRDLGEDPGPRMTEARILIRKAHGFLTTGETIGEAAFYLMAAERAAKAQLILDQHGKKEHVREPWLSRWQMTPVMAAEEFAQHAAWIRSSQADLTG